MRTGVVVDMPFSKADEEELEKLYEEALDALRTHNDEKWNNVLARIPVRMNKEFAIRIMQTPEHEDAIASEQWERYEANKEEVHRRCTPKQLEGVLYYVEYGSERMGADIAGMEFEEFRKLLQELNLLIM
jgi:hypothetical protein